MYSPKVVEKKIARIRDKSEIKLKRLPVAKSLEWREQLESLRVTPTKWKRAFTDEEKVVMRNEQLLCKIDYRYFAERYAFIEYDTESGKTGIGPMKFWESQEVTLAKMAKAEEQQFDAEKRGDICPGIKIVNHKARSLGFTALGRTLVMQTMLFARNTLAMAASVDEDKVGELYRRDKLIYDSLPFYLKPPMVFEEKNQHLQFEHGAYLLYQQASQKSGMGAGRKFRASHLTECSTWEKAKEQIQLHFFPAIPRAISSLALLESTAYGRGNWWHEFTEAVRKGEWPDWIYVFIPCYAEPKKYRSTPPVNWTPDDTTLAYAKQCEETSPLYMGHRVVPAKEHLYWWQTQREAHIRSGDLALFLTSYCATPEESFQHWEQSAFDTFTLDALAEHAGAADPRIARGRPYELLRGEDVKDAGEGYAVPGCGALRPMERRELDYDPRGIVWIYEKPIEGARYFAGVDAAQGITAWDRMLRKRDDAKTDNGVISVIRRGRQDAPDVQVAEYAGPVDPEDLAVVSNFLGRLYGHPDDDNQALMIIEAYPGPGGITQRDVIARFGYTNLWRPTFSNVLAPEHPRNVVGFRASRESRRDLWIKSGGHIRRRKIVLRSPWLIEELRDCRWDDFMYNETARAAWGRHDDRVIAVMLAIYAAHDLASEPVETSRKQVREIKEGADWQNSDCSLDEMTDQTEEHFLEILEGVSESW